MTAQRKYKDADGTTRYVHMDERSIGGSSADVTLVRPVAAALDFGSGAGTVFDAVPSTQAGKFSADISCEGFDTIVLHVEASKSGATVKIRAWAKDATGTYSPSATKTVDVVNVKDDSHVTQLKAGYYHCVPLSFETLGAAAMKFELVTLSAGSVSAWAAAR